MKKNVINHLKEISDNECAKDFLNSKFYNNLNVEHYSQLFEYLANNDKNKEMYVLMFNRNIALLENFINEYYNDSDLAKTKINRRGIYKGKDFGSSLFHNVFYVDIDKYGTKKHDSCNVICTGDALFSFNRILEHNNFILNNDVINEYKKLREHLIFYFPPEPNFKGINSQRMKKFNDKIDYLLFDLKKYFNDRTNNNCALYYTYTYCHKTNIWLKSFKNFDEFVEWYKIQDIFVKKINGEYKIFDLEICCDESAEQKKGCFIDDHPDACSDDYKWKNYYNNLKRKVKQYNDKHFA